MNYKKFGILGAILLVVCALMMVTAVSSSSETTDDGNYTLQINTSGKWRLDTLGDNEILKLREYLNDNLILNPETGKLSNPNDRADWVLIWWKKQ